MQRPQFINGEVYHIFNRGVEKRRIFEHEKDYFRFVHDMFEFNDVAPAFNTGYFSDRTNRGKQGVFRKQRTFLVEILCFCLMPNHYHFLLRQINDGGITEFMRKIGGGYTNYFNKKYSRVGVLFQGKFKAVHVQKENHILYLPHYIHLNPLDLFMPEWRQRRIRNTKRALQFLNSYRWSSYLDFVGKHNFPSVTQRDLLFQIYGSRTSIDYREEIDEWLSSFDNEDIDEVALEPLSMEVGLQ